jgi:hypothetical protein
MNLNKRSGGVGGGGGCCGVVRLEPNKCALTGRVFFFGVHYDDAHVEELGSLGAEREMRVELRPASFSEHPW